MTTEEMVQFIYDWNDDVLSQDEIDKGMDALIVAVQGADDLREEREEIERDRTSLRCGIKNEENEKIRQTKRANEAERQLGNARISTRSRVAEIQRLKYNKTTAFRVEVDAYEKEVAKWKAEVIRLEEALDKLKADQQ